MLFQLEKLRGYIIQSISKVFDPVNRLTQVVKLVEALEMGKANHSLVCKAAMLYWAGVSVHQCQK